MNKVVLCLLVLSAGLIAQIQPIPGAAVRRTSLPSSCVVGVSSAVVFNSSGADGLYTCDNTGHYALTPSSGGISTPATTLVYKGNNAVNGIVAATPGVDYAGLASTNNYTGQNNMKVQNKIRYADQFALGSSTGGLAEAIADCGVSSLNNACTVWGPNANISASATITLGINQSGITIIGMGTNYGCNGACTTGTHVTWTGAANGTLFSIDGAQNVHIVNLFIDGNGTAGIGIQLKSSGSSTSLNTFENIRIDNVLGSPGRGIEVGATAVANVSENTFRNINITRTVDSVYQDGGQTFTWYYNTQVSNDTNGFNIRNGWTTIRDSESSSNTSAAIRLGNVGSKVYVNDFDWEDSTKFLVVEDAASYIVLTIDNLRSLYTGASPGTIANIGVTTGTSGEIKFVNCKFATLLSSAQATISFLQSTGAGITFDDISNTYLSSPSATVVTTSGSVDVVSIKAAAVTGKALASASTITAAGLIKTTGGDIEGPAGFMFKTTGRSKLYANQDGMWTSYNAAQTGFFRWNFGGLSDSFPALCLTGTDVAACTGAGTTTIGSFSAPAFVSLAAGKYKGTHGANSTWGVVALASGTATVSTTAIAALAAAGGAGDVVSLVLQNCSTCGTLSVGTVTAGTSFVINSTNALDASNVYWEIRHIN